jgi:hypothetical protein
LLSNVKETELIHFHIRNAVFQSVWKLSYLIQSLVVLEISIPIFHSLSFLPCPISWWRWTRQKMTAKKSKLKSHLTQFWKVDPPIHVKILSHKVTNTLGTSLIINRKARLFLKTISFVLKWLWTCLILFLRKFSNSWHRFYFYTKIVMSLL